MKKTSYIDRCNQLGFVPESHFVKINANGSIGFTAGKPEEIRHLFLNVLSAGLRPSAALREAAVA